MPALDPAFLAVQALNGLQLASLLFLLSVGLSVVFGLMNFIDLAHGTLYMLGAYAGLEAVALTGSYWAALALAPLAVAAAGAALHFVLLRRMESASPMRQVLATFGLIFVGLDAIRYVWGDYAHAIAAPPQLAGAVAILGEPYPAYRLFVIAVGAAVFAALFLGLERTRLGAAVRAGVDDRETASALGIDVGAAFFIVFCIGCALAGLAGVVAAPVLSIHPGMDMSILVLALIIVVVGGPGSLKGAAAGALAVGAVETFGQVLFPAFAGVALYAAMAAALLLRPAGLVPARRR